MYLRECIIGILLVREEISVEELWKRLKSNSITKGKFSEQEFNHVLVQMYADLTLDILPETLNIRLHEIDDKEN